TKTVSGAIQKADLSNVDNIAALANDPNVSAAIDAILYSAEEKINAGVALSKEEKQALFLADMRDDEDARKSLNDQVARKTSRSGGEATISAAQIVENVVQSRMDTMAISAGSEDFDFIKGVWVQGAFSKDKQKATKTT